MIIIWKFISDNAASCKTNRSGRRNLLEGNDGKLPEPGQPENQRRNGSGKYYKAFHSKNCRPYKRRSGGNIFTSGGTEGNNWAIFGTAKGYARSGRHLLQRQWNIPPLRPRLKFGKGKGYDVTFLSVDGDGLADVEELKRSIRHDTILVSVIFINNEVGAVQPVEEIGDIIKGINPNIIYHVDAVQGFGKKAVDVKKWKANCILLRRAGINSTPQRALDFCI